MNKPQLIAAALAAALLLAASAAPAEDEAVDAVATVNGKPISKNALRSLIGEIEKQNNDEKVPEDKAADALISRELLRQEAEKKGLQKSATVQGRLENVTRDVLAQAAVENFRKSVNVSEEDIRKEYDSRVAGADMTEYKAQHILLETEQEANDVLASLKKKGVKFADLAKKLSKDPSAKQNGGDIGWFNPQQMVPEFSAAVAGLKNGETAAAPVQSKFGWHVIKREDSRKQEPPAFDAVKDQIRNMLVGQKIQQHVEELKAAAKIENTLAGKK